MSIVPDAEQRQLRETVRSALNAHSSPALVREAMDSPQGFDQRLWQRLADELGVVGLAIPERYGGAGGTFSDVCIVTSELGRAVQPVPFLSTAVLAVHALLSSGDEDACARWLPDIAGGRLTAAVAFSESGQLHPANPATRADRIGSGWIINGEKTIVIAGADAGLVLVIATTPDGPTLFAVTQGAAGLSHCAAEPLDLTRRLATMTFRNSPAVLVGTPGNGHTVLDRVLDLGRIALAHEQVGGAERCVQIAIEYAKIRVQFHRPIGTFQAVKHLLADAYVENDCAKLAAAHAADVVDSGVDAATHLALQSSALASDAYLGAAGTCIQVHGAIGFTWEHEAQLHFRRASSDRQLLGAPELHRDRLAGRLIESIR